MPVPAEIKRKPITLAHIIILIASAPSSEHQIAQMRNSRDRSVGWSDEKRDREEYSRQYVVAASDSEEYSPIISVGDSTAGRRKDVFDHTRH